MRKGKLWIVLIPLTLTLLQLDCFAFAADNQLTRETLRGLEGVRVALEPLKWIIEQRGLTTAQLQNDTELKLRLAGIKVTPSEESPVIPGKPLLYVNAKVIKQGSKERYILHVRVELSQGVALVRAPKVRSSAATWSVSVTGISPKLSPVRDQVKELVDLFINAYLSVNPK